MEWYWPSAVFVINHRGLGAKVDLLTSSQLQEKFPWMNTDDITLAGYGMFTCEEYAVMIDMCWLDIKTIY